MKSLIFQLIIYLAILSGYTTENPSKKTWLRSNKKQLDSLGQTILAEGDVLGFSIAIDSAGKTWYQQGFGYTNLDQTQQVDKNTRFDIASISKLIGVNVIMKLVEKGKLDLDDTLYKLLPQFPEKEIAQKLTLRHLISHTSGLQDYAAAIDSVFMQTGVVPGKKDFLNYFEGKKLLFEPGTHYQYCNSGFMLMAFIAERATGQTWQELINQIVNEPTGLDFQLIKYAADLPETAPIVDVESGMFKEIPTWVYVIGDGGLTATAESLASFPFFWANEKIIPMNLYEAMAVPKKLNDGTRTGYGFGVRSGAFLGEPIIGHTGGWKSTYAIMAYFPEREMTFVGLMNTDGTPASMTEIFAQYMSLILDKSIPDYKKSAIELQHPERFVGQYHGYDEAFDRIGKTITIKMQEDGKLYYCLGNYCEQIYYMGDNKFWLESFPFDFITFEENEGGRISAINEFYYGFFQVLRTRV